MSRPPSFRDRLADAMDRSAALDAVDPVGTTEVAERLGVKRGTVEQWRWRADTGFPEARWRVGGRPAWDWSEVAAWATETGRLESSTPLFDDVEEA